MSSYPSIEASGTVCGADLLEHVGAQVRSLLGSLDPASVTVPEARRLQARFLALGKLADAGAVLVAHAVAAAHEHGVGAATKELARSAGVSAAEAERMVSTSKVLPSLARTRHELVAGRLSRAQVALVADAASCSPVSERELLDVARFQDLVGLRKQAERVKAATRDGAADRARAHANRSVRSWVKHGEWHLHASGPVDIGAEIQFGLQPFWDHTLRQASKENRVEPYGAHGFDALTLMARGASGSVNIDALKLKKRRWQGVVRADASAIARGHTVAGEICEIPGIGPIDVEKAIELLGSATVRILIKQGRDVRTVATTTRYIPPELSFAIAEKANFECTNRACSHSLFIDYDHDELFSVGRDTSYCNLDGLCSQCHGLKTHHGYTIHHHDDGTTSLIPPEDDPDPP